MARRLVIHVGTHKTGTTALQDGMAARADVLAAAGWRYPAAGRIAGHTGHHAIAYELTGHPAAVPDGTPVEDLFTELAGHPGDVVLSSEALTGIVARPEGFVAFLARARAADYAPEIVVLLREQASYAMSLYVTLAQLDWPLGLSDFPGLAAGDGEVGHAGHYFPFRYDAFLAGLERFGVPVAVGSYHAMQGALGPGFAALARLPEAVFAAPLPEANRRIDAAAALIAWHRALTGAPPAPEVVARYAVATRMASPDGLSPAEAGGFAAAFAPANAALRARGIELPPPDPRPGHSLVPVFAESFVRGAPSPDIPALRRAEMAALRAEIAVLRASTSWRVTAPLRALARRLGR